MVFKQYNRNNINSAYIIIQQYQLILLIQYIRQMICLGKSYRSSHRDAQDNKENIDHNIVKLKPADKAFKDMPKQPALLKKVSDAPTACSSQPQYDFHGENLKRQYSQQIAIDYSEDIFEHISHQVLDLEGFLGHHTITPSLRAKMVDWMIQVLSSYKMSEESFFRSVTLMDAYLKNEEKVQDTRDIHLIGVSAMFSAMKFQEINPLRLSLIAQKIARKKFEKKQIIDKQSRMMFVLGFNLEFSTVFDLVKHLNHQIYLDLKPSLAKYLQKIIVYLSKMCAFSNQLISRPNSILASAIYFIALKTLEQVHKNFCPQNVLPNICCFTGESEEDILAVGREVLQLAKTFSKLYPNLSNLKKFNRFEYQSQ